MNPKIKQALKILWYYMRCFFWSSRTYAVVAGYDFALAVHYSSWSMLAISIVFLYFSITTDPIRVD